MALSCYIEFSGYSDYWGGMSGRGHGRGCAFAYYGKNTTLRNLVDQWVEDTWTNEYDFEDLPDSVTSDDIRDCILDALTESGRDDYDNDRVCEWSEEWMSINDVDPDSDDDDDEDWGESPVVILCIEWTVCQDCDNLADDDGHDDSLCSECNAKHYGE